MESKLATAFLDSVSLHSLRCYFAEFTSTFFFVFAGVGASVSVGKLTSDAPLDTGGLVAISVAHALALTVAVALAADCSGGHVNPAVTFGLVVGRHISILTGVFYVVAQLLGSIVACFFFSVVTAGQAIVPHTVTYEMTATGGVLMEFATTYALVYTVYATMVDRKPGSPSLLGPISIGFIVGANMLATGPFTGGSMNPARSFGAAVVSGKLKDGWVYWVGPICGGAAAGLVKGKVFASGAIDGHIDNVNSNNQHAQSDSFGV
ncbi:Aquaporin [Nymphaea thermarum]|nr:Aquaporin [Nymphaea thermarum]